MSTIVTRSGKGSPLTHAEVDSNFTNLNTDKLELSGGTLTGALNFGDNVKATFGASDDLQIYHDGSNSYISDQGTGNTKILSNYIAIKSADDSTLGAEFLSGGKVGLRYNNSEKLATTSTGINVTGTVVADGAAIGESTANTTVTIGGSYANGLEIAQNGIDATSSARLFFDSTTDTSAIYNSGGDLTIAKSATVGSASGNKSMTLGSNGDISFYEDTGTTAKFFWDASLERLGIGTASPIHELDVEGQAWIRGNTQGVDDLIHLGEYSDSSYPFSTIGYDDVNGDRLFFDVNRYGAQFMMRRHSAAGADINMMQVSGSGSTNLTLFNQANPSTSTSVTEKVKLHTDGSSYFNGGNVGIGTNNPNSAADLHIHSTSGTALWLTSNGGNPSDAGFIRMSEQLDGSGAYFELQHDGSNNVLNLYSSNQGSTVQSWNRVGGNVNFHNSSGTAKLTWHAVDEELQLASGVALELNGWTITESGGSLYFATGGTNKMKLDASGNLDVVGSVNANATIT